MPYFSAHERTSGREPWRSDLSSAGTGPIADLLSRHDSSHPASLAPLGRDLVFSAQDGTRGHEPCRLSLASVAARGLLRDDNIRDIEPVTPAFASLRTLDPVAEIYRSGFPSGSPEPDDSVLTDSGRPLVFNRLEAAGTMYLTWMGGRLRIDFSGLDRQRVQRVVSAIEAGAERGCQRWR